MIQVITQYRVFRSDLRDNPFVYYLFGDNENRAGLDGQAKEMRGEPNAIGIRTKRAPTLYTADYWTDKNYTKNVKMIEEDLQKAWEILHEKRVLVIPSDGLGGGLSKLKIHAPQTFSYLNERLIDLTKVNSIG